MKKILLLFFIICPLLLEGQPASGDGSSGSPYSGVITTPWTLSGDKYCGDLSVSSGTLTIEAGSILRFGSGNNLTISGTGALSAVGSAVSKITFTASGTSWGHLYFNAPNESNQSRIDHCIFEKGDVHTYSDNRGYGGAVYSNFSNLLISNSLFRNNYGDWGGAIFVGSSKNPRISGCIILNNRSDHGGGGIYCWNSSSSTIENCIFDGNQSLETSEFYYTGGGLAAQISCSIKVINCTFVNNLSTQAEGKSILLHASPNAKIINSICWGSSDKQIYCYGTTAATVINSAYRGITFTTGTPINPLVLNSSNDASDGPNFSSTDGSDWSLKFISPCRDAGVNSYPGITPPAADYKGNPTIYNKDMGAYEVQYSRWKTSPSDPATWEATGNWEQGINPSHANGTGDVIIPSLSSSSSAPSITGTVTINTGDRMILLPGAKATVSTLNNNGSLLLKSDNTGISSLIVNSYSGNNADVELYLTGGSVPDGYRWHLISSPFTSCSITPVSSVTLNLAQWIESMNRGSLDEGYVAFDGFIYPSGPLNGPTFNTFISGTGYNYYYSSARTYTLSGQLNTADRNVNVKCTDPSLPLLYGHNLVGNPFSSGLNWDAIVNNPGYPLNTSKVLHYRKDGEHVYYINGVGSEPGVNGIIPPMQGFFIKGYDPSVFVNLAASARVHDNIPSRYKGDAPVIPIIRLKISNGEYSDYTTVRFDEAAKPGFDYDFDAPKDFISKVRPGIYTTDGVSKYTINGIPFPSTSVEIPVVVNINSAGTHSIDMTEMLGMNYYRIYLKDKLTGDSTNLRFKSSVPFTSETGLFTDRFILKVSDMTTGIEDPLKQEDPKFKIYQNNGSINLQPLTSEWDNVTGDIRILDISGRTVNYIPDNFFSRTSVVQVPSPDARSLYLVEIRSGLRKYVQKVVIR